MRLLFYILSFLLLPILGFSQATSVSIGTSSIGTLSSTYNTWIKVDPNLTLTSMVRLQDLEFKFLKHIQVVIY